MTAKTPTPAERIHLCQCKGCAALRRVCGKDLALLEFYATRLLQRGWAGTLSPEERAYRMAHAPGAEGRADTARKRGFGQSPRTLSLPL